MSESEASPLKESRYLRAARIAYGVTQAHLPEYAHPKSLHLFSLPQLAACVLLAGYFDLSHRAMADWLRASDQVCDVLELDRVPDHSTLSRTRQKLTNRDFRRMIRKLRERM